MTAATMNRTRAFGKCSFRSRRASRPMNPTCEIEGIQARLAVVKAAPFRQRRAIRDKK